MRAADLADVFEVSKRTIYRDMLALDEAGVPIVSIPGQGYSLVEGYFLPPVTFSTDEAMMLLLGADFVGQNFDAQYRDAAISARDKIFTVLPQQLRSEVDYLEDSIHFITFNASPTTEQLQQLRRAIIQRQMVSFRYHARYHSDSSNAESFRETDPYALIHIGGAWTLIAYCHMRQGIRHFRLSRMQDITILKKSFTRSLDFKVRVGNDNDKRTILVKAIFNHDIIFRIQESPSGFQVAEQSHPDGLLVTFAVRQDEDILNWLLSWGSQVRVLEPETLRYKLALEAEKILKNHQL